MFKRSLVVCNITAIIFLSNGFTVNYAIAENTPPAQSDNPAIIPGQSLENHNAQQNSLEQDIAANRAREHAMENNDPNLIRGEFVLGDVTYTSGRKILDEKGNVVGVANGDFVRHVQNRNAGLDFRVEGETGQDGEKTYGKIIDGDATINGTWQNGDFTWTSGTILEYKEQNSLVASGRFTRHYVDANAGLDFTVRGVTTATGAISYGYNTVVGDTTINGQWQNNDFTWISGTVIGRGGNFSVMNGTFTRHYVDQTAGIDFTITGTSNSFYDPVLSYNQNSIQGDVTIDGPLSHFTFFNLHYACESEFLWASGDIIGFDGTVFTVANGNFTNFIRHQYATLDFEVKGETDNMGNIRYAPETLRGDTDFGYLPSEDIRLNSEYGYTWQNGHIIVNSQKNGFAVADGSLVRYVEAGTWVPEIQHLFGGKSFYVSGRSDSSGNITYNGLIEEGSEIVPGFQTWYDLVWTSGVYTHIHTYIWVANGTFIYRSRNKEAGLDFAYEGRTDANGSTSISSIINLGAENDLDINGKLSIRHSYSTDYGNVFTYVTFTSGKVIGYDDSSRDWIVANGEYYIDGTDIRGRTDENGLFLPVEGITEMFFSRYTVTEITAPYRRPYDIGAWHNGWKIKDLVWTSGTVLGSNLGPKVINGTFTETFEYKGRVFTISGRSDANGKSIYLPETLRGDTSIESEFSMDGVNWTSGTISVSRNGKLIVVSGSGYRDENNAIAHAVSDENGNIAYTDIEGDSTIECHYMFDGTMRPIYFTTEIRNGVLVDVPYLPEPFGSFGDVSEGEDCDSTDPADSDIDTDQTIIDPVVIVNRTDYSPFVLPDYGSIIPATPFQGMTNITPVTYSITAEAPQALAGYGRRIRGLRSDEALRPIMTSTAGFLPQPPVRSTVPAAEPAIGKSSGAQRNTVSPQLDIGSLAAYPDISHLLTGADNTAMPRLLDKAYGLKAAISGEGAASRFSNSIIENNDVAGQEINSKNNHPKEKPVLPQDTLGKYENSRDERRFYESYYQNSNTLIDNQMYDIPVALKEKGSPLFAGRAAGGKPEPYLIEETDAGQESAGGLIMKAFGSNKYNIDEIYLNNRSSGNDKTRKPALYEENAFTDMLFCLSGNPS